MVVRNEAAPDRYLKRVLTNAKQFCDELVVLDDASTDDTVAVCKAAGATVHERTVGGGWWGGASAASGEASARETLWTLASAACGSTGWVLVVDADMELVGLTPRDFRRLLTASNVNAFAWPLWDVWDSEDKMRVDSWWKAHLLPRVWLARAHPLDGYTPMWHTNGRTIHSGHLPPNYPLRVGLAPQGVAWRHLSYLNPAHRKQKARKYLAL